MIHRASKLINKIMKKNFFTKVFFSYFLLTSILVASQSESFEKGIELFKKNKFEKSKIHFERDLVFNPKNEKSYLYLSKIFKNFDKRDLEEQNLNTVILLDPSNEEAIYSLAKLKLDSSDYKKSRELNDKLSSLCNKFCIESKKLKIEIENLSKK